MTENQDPPVKGPFIATLQRAANLYIDAGISSIRILASDAQGRELGKLVIPGNEDLVVACASYGLDRLPDSTGIYMTGKLQETVRHHIGRGELILPSAALWSAGRSMLEGKPLGIIELSASGYVIIGIDEEGELKDDMLSVNPRCGAGSGINLDRVDFSDRASSNQLTARPTMPKAPLLRSILKDTLMLGDHLLHRQVLLNGHT